jgi:hypothetical protein
MSVDALGGLVLLVFMGAVLVIVVSGRKFHLPEKRR